MIIHIDVYELEECGACIALENDLNQLEQEYPQIYIRYLDAVIFDRFVESIKSTCIVCIYQDICFASFYKECIGIAVLNLCDHIVIVPFALNKARVLYSLL